MKSSRLLFAAAAAFAVVGCNLVLGIKGDYTSDDDGAEGGSVTDGGHLPTTDATVTDGSSGTEGGPGTDAMISDATMAADVFDAAPMLCPDGAASPLTAPIGAACCLNNAFACDNGQKLEQLICGNGTWAPNGSCMSGSLCRTDDGEYPDGGAADGGAIIGAGTLGLCATEITACVGHNAGDIVCSGSKLVTCGADLTTAYTETCGSAALCAAHTSSHCPQCLDGQDFLCTGNTPSACSDGGYVQNAACSDTQNCNPNDGTCVNQVCTPNTAFKCSGDDLQQCNPTGTTYVDAGACEAGTCDKTVGMCDLCVKSTNYGCNQANTGYTACNAAGSAIISTPCGGTTPFCFQALGSNPTCVACLQASDCTATPPDACHVPACTSGSCGFQPGNNGQVTTPPDGVGCTEMVCSGGAMVSGPAPNTAACMVGGAGGVAGTCDGAGNCVANP